MQKSIKAFLLFFVFFSISCAKQESRTQKDGFVNGQIEGELIHAQYWDTHDYWILDGLKINLYFDDDSLITTSFDDKSISYSLLPESPVGLTSGMKLLNIQNIFFTDVNGNKNKIPDYVTSVKIVKFPYEIVNTNNNREVPPWIIYASIFFVIVIIFLLYKFKWRRK